MSSTRENFSGFFCNNRAFFPLQLQVYAENGKRNSKVMEFAPLN